MALIGSLVRNVFPSSSTCYIYHSAFIKLHTLLCTFKYSTFFKLHTPLLHISLHIFAYTKILLVNNLPQFPDILASFLINWKVFRLPGKVSRHPEISRFVSRQPEMFLESRLPGKLPNTIESFALLWNFFSYVTDIRDISLLCCWRLFPVEFSFWFVFVYK